MFGKIKIYIIGIVAIAVFIYICTLEFKIMSLKAKVGVLLDNNKSLEVKNGILETNQITLNEAINRQNEELAKMEEVSNKVHKEFEEWNKLPDEQKYGDLTQILKSDLTDIENNDVCSKIIKKLDKIKLMRTSDL